MAAPRTVIVLGGGAGGVVAARRLRRRLAATDRVVLVDREPHHLFQPSLLWVMTGRRLPGQIQRPLAALAPAGIEFVQGEITGLDPASRSVTVGERTLAADALIVALGADLDPGRIPGLADGGHNLYSLSGALAIRRSLTDSNSGRIVVLTAAPAYKCPAAPYEAAMLLGAVAGRDGGHGRTVALYAAEAGPMLTAGPAVSKAVTEVVVSRGVEYHPDHQVVSVDATNRTVLFQNGVSTGYDLLVYVPPHRVPRVLERAGLVAETGWVAVDPRTLATGAAGVFAIGDAAGIPIPSGKLLPKAGVFAHAQAEVVAANLAAEWSGRQPGHAFDGVGACFIETGGGRAGYGSGDFYASPMPKMVLRSPARRWHWGKVLFEKYWMHRWF
jgi:sulfide:quinone oxidoreductase